MSIFIPMTIARETFLSRCSRSLVRWLAVQALAIGLSAAPAVIGKATASQPQDAQTSGGNSARAATTKSKGAEGSVFCNGIRLQDEIEVVNTRSICGGGNSELMRTGLKFENYAICDEVGYRRWQRSDLENFLTFDSTV